MKKFFFFLCRHWPRMCLSTNSAISSNIKPSRFTLRNRPSNALVQCATILTTSSTKLWSGVIFPYQLCITSLTIIAMMAYSCTSISLLLVNGGKTLSIATGSVVEPECTRGQSTRRMRAAVARSEWSNPEMAVVFGDGCLLVEEDACRTWGAVAVTPGVSIVLLNVGPALGRGWRDGTDGRDCAMFEMSCGEVTLSPAIMSLHLVLGLFH